MSPIEIYEDLLKQNEAVVSSQMFGKPCGKINGKAFISFFQDEIAFKLGKDNLEPYLKSFEGSKLFDPSGKNRPFKDWLQIPIKYKKDYLKLSEIAQQFTLAQK